MRLGINIAFDHHRGSGGERVAPPPSATMTNTPSNSTLATSAVQGMPTRANALDARLAALGA